MKRLFGSVREAWARRRGLRGAPIIERMARLEERLKELEEEMGAADVVTATDGEDVWSGPGKEPRRLGEGEDELAKARSFASLRMTGPGGGLESPRSDLGAGDGAGGAMEEVRPGMPQGIAGQQARHGAARFWEGVL